LERDDWSDEVIKQYPMSATVPASGPSVISTRILEAGSGRDVVVCVHGVGSRADRFRPTLKPLAQAGYHVYSLDLPGHGFATKGALPLSVPYYAEFVAAIVEQLPADRVTLVGTSLGGHIGGYMATLENIRMDRLVMIGTLGVVPMSEADRFNISRVILRKRSVEDCVGKLRALLWDDGLVTREWAEEESAINNSHGAEATFARLGDYFENEINEDIVRDALLERRNRLPMGLMWGDRDAIVSVETGRECMAALPGVPMAWISDTGHAPYYERPQDFVTAMDMLFDESRRETPEYSI
jgi:2-hydroxy-6-oxonona-2,4-dienedioate hydrolase